MKKIIFCLLGVFSLFQCSKKNTQDSNTVEIVDVMGRKVKIPEKVERIIGLNSGSMRFISYMDAIPLVVGVEDKERVAERPYNFAFPEIKQKTIIGPQPGGDAEMIMKANPQVIFWSTSSINTPDELQRKTGIPVIAIENGELGVENDKIYKTLRIIGKVLKKEERAEDLIAYIENSMKELQSRTQGINTQKSTVYAGGLSFNGPHGIGSTRANFTPFFLVHAKNVVAELNKGELNTKPIMIDIEKLMVWNPDYIFIDSGGWEMAKREMTINTPLHNTLKAIKNNQVYLIPRYINNNINYDYALIISWYIAKVLYPEQFKDVEINKKSLEILEKFYSKKLELKNFDLEYRQLKEKDYE